jgi:hypothetical protein
MPTLNELPNRVSPLSDSDDPNEINSNTEHDEPILEIDLIEREEPHCTKSITDIFMHEPMCVSPITDAEEPHLIMLLRDILDPKFMKSNTETALPKRVNDLKLSEDPISVSAMMESLQTEPI